MPAVSPSGQSVMDEGPGLRSRVRETNAAINEIAPKTGEPAAPARPISPKEKVNPGGAPFGSRGKERRMDVSNDLKPLGSFKTGTDYVPKTGMYKLHKGEAVKTKDENMTDWTKGITGGGKKPKKEIKRITHTKMHDGKIHTTHEHHHPEHHPDEHFAHDDTAALASHMENHAGTPNDGEAAGAGGDQMAQLTASPSPAPAPEAAGPMQGAGV